jgi:hypothetical protein
MPKATAPVESNTPKKLKNPDQTHRDWRGQGMGVNDSCNGIRRIVESVDEFKAKRNQQRNAKQKEWQDARHGRSRLADIQVNAIGSMRQSQSHYGQE